MRKNINSCRIEGYVYDASELTIRESGPDSKKPGTVFISGNLSVAVDEEGLNVVKVHFTYVTEVFAKSGKTNATFGILKKIIEDNSSWLAVGKEKATKVRIDGSLGLNDFYNKENERVSAKRCEGSFVSVVSNLSEERNTFQEDMVIMKVSRVEANPERNIDNDYVVVSGEVFDFRNAILPVEFVVKNENGMKYFEDLDVTGAEPVYTKVWGRINSLTSKVEQAGEESAWGETFVRTYDRTVREWVITGTAKVPYDFGDESVMTAEELKQAMQDREVHWADIEARNKEWRERQAQQSTATKSSSSTVEFGNFSF